MESSKYHAPCRICKKDMLNTNSSMLHVHTDCIPKSTDDVIYIDKNTVINIPNDMELGAYVRNLYWKNKK